MTREWKEGRWWRILDEQGNLWCETSDANEARQFLRPGDKLQKLWYREERQWRDV